MKAYIKGILQKIDHSESILNINARNRDYVYKHNPRRYLKYADDKAESKKLFSDLKIPYPETYQLIQWMGDIESKWAKISKKDSFVIKPARGRAGNGIVVLEKSESHWITPSGERYTEEMIKKHCADVIFGNYSLGLSDLALIEERIIQHDVFTDIYDSGVADIRIIVFKGVPVMAMSRIPTNKSNGKANLHQGAIGVGIDLNTGRLTKGYDYVGYIDTHPDSGIKFTNMMLPYWKEIFEILKILGCHIPLEFLGVDIVLDQEKGPMVMEINARPGLEIQNVNHTSLRNMLEDISCNGVF
jgi:alpha-L-glutamate ligase-like protein